MASGGSSTPPVWVLGNQGPKMLSRNELSPSSSIPTFSEASWEESIGGSQAGYLSNPLPQTEREGYTSLHTLHIRYCGIYWLNLVSVKMAHVAELALVRDQQKRDWSFFDDHLELSLKGYDTRPILDDSSDCWINHGRKLK